jgi:hypothetical protein
MPASNGAVHDAGIKTADCDFGCNNGKPQPLTPFAAVRSCQKQTCSGVELVELEDSCMPFFTGQQLVDKSAIKAARHVHRQYESRPSSQSETIYIHRELRDSAIEQNIVSLASFGISVFFAGSFLPNGR